MASFRLWCSADMWCPRCKTETTVAGSRSSQDARCGACGSTLQASKSSDTTIREARDIIARWSSSDLLDQISALPPLPPLPKPHFPRLTDPVDSFRSSYRTANRSQSEAQRHSSDESDEADDQQSTTSRLELQTEQEERLADPPEASTEKPTSNQTHNTTADDRGSKDVRAAEAPNSEPELSEDSRPSAEDFDLPIAVDLEFGDDEDTDPDFTESESADDAASFGHAPYSFAAVKRPTTDLQEQADSHEAVRDELHVDLPVQSDATVQQDVVRQDTSVKSIFNADEDNAGSKQHQPSQPANDTMSEVADFEQPETPQLAATSATEAIETQESVELNLDADAVSIADEGDQTQLAVDTPSKANDAESTVAAAARKVAVVALPTEATRARPRLTDVLKPFFKRRAKPQPVSSDSSAGTNSGDSTNDSELRKRQTEDLSTSDSSSDTAVHGPVPVNQPLVDSCNVEVEGNSQPQAAPAAELKQPETPDGSHSPARRRPFTRAEQPRQARERTPLSRPPRKSASSTHNKTSAAALNEGQKPVTRKIRVDRPGGEEIQPEQIVPTNVAGARIQSNSSSSGRRYRIDDGEAPEATLNTGDRRVRTQHRPRQRYIDDAHESAVRGPHFQVTAPKRSNLTSMTGQFLAYLGVLGLTIGTAIVIYGHFGGYSDYTPTGWLVTTVAQMMLFLGVINLVSGGIEQTNDDVSARINTLGEQLMRIEQVTEQALRGPKISAQRYAQPDAEVAEHESDLVPTRERS